MRVQVASLARLGLGLLSAAFILAGCGGSAAPAASAAQPAAAAAPSVKTLFISADVVEGSKNVSKDQADARSCVLTSRFPRNSEMVFRARVFDPATGNLMDGKAVTQLQVKLATGNTIDMKYGLHPKDTGEGYWTGSWVVPKDQATGTLKYTITANSADGRTGQFVPMSVAPSLPAITADVLPDVAA